jgi:hypothetical protein
MGCLRHRLARPAFRPGWAQPIRGTSGNTSSHFGATVAFAALRYFALNATDHRSHREQNSMIRRYIAWRNRHTNDEELRAVSIRAKVA